MKRPRLKINRETLADMALVANLRTNATNAKTEKQCRAATLHTCLSEQGMHSYDCKIGEYCKPRRKRT
jgi:hypothetical protein